MSATRSELPTGCGRATVLKVVLRYQYSFAAVTREYGLLRLEGAMVVKGLNDGEVQELGSPLESASLGQSRDVAAWRGQRHEPLSPSSGYSHRLSAFRLLYSVVGCWKRESEVYVDSVMLKEGTVVEVSERSEGPASKWPNKARLSRTLVKLPTFGDAYVDQTIFAFTIAFPLPSIVLYSRSPIR